LVSTSSEVCHSEVALFAREESWLHCNAAMRDATCRNVVVSPITRHSFTLSEAEGPLAFSTSQRCNVQPSNLLTIPSLATSSPVPSEIKESGNVPSGTCEKCRLRKPFVAVAQKVTIRGVRSDLLGAPGHFRCLGKFNIQFFHTFLSPGLHPHAN
jgi:hypothetical protein